jgi:hypothetical protein
MKTKGGLKMLGRERAAVLLSVETRLLLTAGAGAKNSY